MKKMRMKIGRSKGGSVMNEELEMACFQIITYVGTARSCFVNAIQSAKTGNFA